MPTTKKIASNTDAIALLTTDHKKVKKLFKDFEDLKKDGTAKDKKALALEICDELTVHAELEEEVFYPVARKAIGDDDLMNEAEVEHATAKDLIAQIKALGAADPLFDAKVTVLGEYINHHVEEEQNEIFPRVKKTKIDLEALGEEMTALKETKLTRLMGSTKKQAAHPKSTSTHL